MQAKLLKDVSALANSQGGHILFGMAEVDGSPTELVGLAENPDELIRRMENSCRDAIQPRITGLVTIPVRLANGAVALVLRIPRSWAAPHRASYQGWNKYFLRSTAGVHEASVEELRELFTGALTREARVERFVNDRVTAIEANAGSMRLRGGGHLVLHLIPFDAFSGQSAIDLSGAHANGGFAPMGSSTGYNYSFNLHGLVTYRPVAENGYLQLFRNGIIETVDTDVATLGNGAPGIHAYTVGILISRWVKRYVGAYAAIGISAPLTVMTTLTGVYGVRVHTGEDDNTESHPLPTNRVRFPEVTINEFGGNYMAGLRPIMDALWNAGGSPRCRRYRDDGSWVG